MNTIFIDSIMEQLSNNLQDPTSWKISSRTAFEIKAPEIEVTVYSTKKIDLTTVHEYRIGSSLDKYVGTLLNDNLLKVRSINPALLIIDAKSGGAQSLNEAKNIKQEYDNAFRKLSIIKKVLNLKDSAKPEEVIDALLTALVTKALIK